MASSPKQKKFNYSSKSYFHPTPEVELPPQLRTKRWRPDLPGWEERPPDPMLSCAHLPYKPPVNAAKYEEPLPLSVEEIE